MAPAADAPGDLGVRGRDDARVDGVDARRASADAAWSGSRRIGSTSREAGHGAADGVGRRRDGGARARAARERRARGSARRRRHERARRSAGTSATRSRSCPRATTTASSDAVREVVEREGVDVVLPQSSYDLPALAAARDRFPRRRCSCRRPRRVRRSNDKAETYELLRATRRPGARLPARARRRRGRGGGPRARLSGARRRRQAGLLVGIARLPHPLGARRPRASSC